MSNWIEASIYTTPEGIDAVFGLLISLGIQGAEIVDEGDFHDFLENNTQYWDYVDKELEEAKKCPTHLKIYLPDDLEGTEQLTELKSSLKLLPSLCPVDLGSLEVKVKTVDGDGWYTSWKKHYSPLCIGEKIIVIPEWQRDTDTLSRLPLYINPGMLFGTGGHGTTRLCMEFLEKHVKADDEILDVGCGSGILSILSLVLGAKKAEALDIDESAPKIAAENGELNGFSSDKFHVFCGNILSDTALQKKYTENKSDIVVANIVADVIIPLSAMAADFMKDGGLFICSGIIDERAEEVKTALLQNGFIIEDKKQDGEWHAFLCRR